MDAGFNTEMRVAGNGYAGQASNEYYTISQMSGLYGLSLRALRFYEDRGLIKPLRHGAVRLYDATQRQRVEMILKGKKLGFTLTEIREMLGGRTREQAPELEQALEPQKILTQIGHLERQRTVLDEAIHELRKTHERLAGDPPPAELKRSAG